MLFRSVKNDGLLLPLTHLDTLRIASLNFGDRKAPVFESTNPENDSTLYCTELPFKTDAGKTQSIANTFTVEEWDIPANLY